MVKRVYPFTNENVSCYQDLYNFENAKVLSVLGSGDQYFSSLLYGAKEIEVYDSNYLAWDFFVLKYYGIVFLDYEDFYNFFVTKRLNDLRCLYQLLSYLPNDIANRLAKLQTEYVLLSRCLYLDVIDDKYNNGYPIPYFNKEKYYQLQSILRNKKLPIFYLAPLQALPFVLEKKTYDIILTSNIFDWLYADLEEQCVKEYKELLNKFNYGEIQALYRYKLSENLKQELENNDFEINYVQGVNKLNLTRNSVVSLRNK